MSNEKGQKFVSDDLRAFKFPDRNKVPIGGVKIEHSKPQAGGQVAAAPQKINSQSMVDWLGGQLKGPAAEAFQRGLAGTISPEHHDAIFGSFDEKPVTGIDPKAVSDAAHQQANQRTADQAMAMVEMMGSILGALGKGAKK